MKITKYGNRRLYNHVSTSYVTLQDILAHVRGGGDVTIKDGRTKLDITPQILMATLPHYVVDDKDAVVQFIRNAA